MSKKEKLLASAQKSLQKGQLAKAIKDYQQILQIHSADVRSRQKLAELLGRERRTEEALGEYEAVAKHYGKTGFYLKAIAVYKQMQKLDPSRVDIYLHLAEFNEKQGLVGNALAEYRNLVAHYEKQKMYTDAAAILQKMQELEPENLNILVKIAEIYAKGGLKDRALEEFDHALVILRKKEDFSRVLKLYEIFLPLYPDRPEMKIGMARILIEKGDAEKGMHLLKNLLREDPEQPEILSVLALGYRKLEDYVNERLTYQHLLRNASEDLDLRQGYIRACIDSGESKRALEELEIWREAFLADKRTAALQGLYEALKEAFPQNDQLRTLRSISADAGEKEPQSGDVSALLAELETTDETFSSIGDLLEPEQKANDVDADPPRASKGSVESFPAAEEAEDLEIPLDFLEEVAAEQAPRGFEEHPVELEPAEEIVAEGGAADEQVAAAEDRDTIEEEEDELALELELELELDPELIEELELDPVEEGDILELVSDSADDSAPFDEEILDLELGDALEPEEFTSPKDDGETGEDILELDMAEVLDHHDGRPSSMADLRSELEEAEFYLRQGLIEDAERICRSLLKEHPARPEILDMLSEIEDSRKAAPPASAAGQLFDLEGELADEDLSVLEEGIGAFADSQKGIETSIDAEDTESHYNLGIAYKEMGLLDEAVAEFEKASNNLSRRVGCLTLKGICLVEKGAFDDAEDAFRAGMEQPGLNQGERISLLYELGLLYEGCNKPLEALDSFQSAADADLFFRDVGEKVAALRKKLGMDAGEDEGESGPKGDRDRVSYV